MTVEQVSSESQDKRLAKRRSDYRSPDFLIDSIALEFDLDAQETRVKAVSRVRRNGQHQRPLRLDGEQLTLIELLVDGKPVTPSEHSETHLSLSEVPDDFELTVTTTTNPSKNSSLEGLYMADGAFCTQCEAEGFRKITYFMDRPDVLAEYHVTIRADKQAFPALLSNGNKVASQDLEDGRHSVSWHDPFKKPSYLFALVAGDFDLLTDSFITCSGRAIQLELYVDKGKASRGHHALASLKKAMRWDEEVFGLEYDLDIYMIVAVDFFNMGAMENKGLNVFNSKFVLADSETATDEDYFNIESVIAHEYFHNWTGNRVTCRDWFQLSLKEGLTVFRDQEFSADMSSPLVNRIKQVRVIREHQFAEDASAMAHPIRPDVVMEMNNFYTVTVYNKGAEVIRMLHTLLGKAGFRRGMDLYFARFDGQAVTCDDFVQAMEDASQRDLSQFRRWYSQSGTPVLSAERSAKTDNGQPAISLMQHTPATADQAVKHPLHIPLRFELIDRAGKQLTSADSELRDGLFELTDAKASLPLQADDDDVIPVLLAGFSAPVKLQYPYQPDELASIVKHAKDDFARWDAVQTLYSHFIHGQADSQRASAIEVSEANVLDVVGALLKETSGDKAFVAEMLSVPSFETLCQQVEGFDVSRLYSAREALLDSLSETFDQQWRQRFNQRIKQKYAYDDAQVSDRRLAHLALSYLCRQSVHHPLAEELFEHADNMTDSLASLKALQAPDADSFTQLMTSFESRWHEEPLVLDKWFALHATTPRDDILSHLDLLSGHAQYSINNPNRVRALIGSFAFYNPMGFHASNGSGYRYVTDYLLTLDGVNPQVAARLVTPLIQWQKLDQQRQSLIRKELQRILAREGLSRDLYEKVSKSLEYSAD